MKLYSPSSREDFSYCPRYWWLRKRWKPKRVSYPELCGIGGTAVSDAMAYWNQALIATRAIALDEVVAMGLQSLVTQQACLTTVDRRVSGLKDTEFVDTLPKLVTTAISTLWDTNPLKGHTIIAAEHTFTDFGNARPDVISRGPDGELVVDDYKCKFSVFDEAWMDREFDKHFDGEQRLAYTNMAGTTLFGIILVVIQPKLKTKRPYVIRRTSRVQPHEHALWRNDSVMHYEAMEVIERRVNPMTVPGKAAPHANQYGDCVFKEACIEDQLNVERMRVRYVQIDKGGA